MVPHRRQCGGCSSDHVGFVIRGGVALRRHDMQVSGRGSPRGFQRCGELVIVIRRTFMGMPMDCSLQGIVMVMNVGVVGMFVQGNRKNRHAAHHPQQ